MSDYADLDATVEKIIDAAIEAAMGHAGWARNGEEYVSIASLRSLPVTGDAALGLATTVTAPSAGEPRWINKPILGLNQSFEQDWLAEIGTRYRAWDENIRDLFRPWRWLPEVESSSPALGGIVDAALKVSTGESIDGGARVPANPKLADLADANGQLDHFRGGTVSTFRRNYSRRLEAAVLPNQCGLVCELAEGMLAEAGIINEARMSVASAADAMLQGMKDALPEAGGDGDNAILTVAGVSLAVAGLFVSGPASIFVGGLSITTGLLEGISGSEDSKKISGSTPEKVFEVAESALEDLQADISAEEELVEATFRDVSTKIAGTERGKYDLSSPDLLDSTSPEDLIDRPDVLQVDARILRQIGRQQLKVVAHQVSAAANDLNPYPARYEWYRGAMVGIGLYGPFDAFETACNDLALVLANTGQELGQARIHLIEAADYFDKTDAEVTAQLREHRKEVRHAGLAKLPYSDPADIPYVPQRPEGRGVPRY